MRSLLAVVLAPLAAAVALAPGKQSSSESPNLAERQTAASTSPNPAQPSFTFSQLWDANKKFLDNFIYPADVQQAKAINSTLLAEDVQGRIDITRTFNGRELNTEYLFGLFANLAGAAPGAVSLLGVPLSYEILHFAASQNIVSSLTRCVFPIPSQLKFGTPHSPISNQITNEETPKNRFQFNFTALNLIVPVEIDAWNTFNAQGQISQYDATFKHWQWTVDYLLQAAAKKFNTPTKEATVGVLSQAIAKSICQTSMQYCNGTQNVQYKSSEECFGFLTGKVRFGEAYELGMCEKKKFGLGGRVWGGFPLFPLPSTSTSPQTALTQNTYQVKIPSSAAWFTRTWCPSGPKSTARTSAPRVAGIVLMIKIIR